MMHATLGASARGRTPAERAVTVLLSLLVALGAAMVAVQPALAVEGETYRNPLKPLVPGDGWVESCADPSLIWGQEGEGYWYMYCTTDPLNDEDKDAAGEFNFNKIPMLRSRDLVHWRYMGNAFDDLPPMAEEGAGIWAPEIEYRNGQYYLYYGVTDVTPAISGEPEDCHDDNAIGVATGPTPLGPWTARATPVVYPRRGGDGCNFFWTFDPEVIVADGQPYIYYGSYYGGIEARKLTANGLASIRSTATDIAIGNRYEGAELFKRGSYWYINVSAANCCNGPLTGYSVFTGRSTSPLGPFVDKQGVSFLSGRVGGTPFLSMNGNRFVGPGHNSVFRDFDGQWWTVYHAINRNDPYYEGAVGFTKRPVLLDPIDWIDGWPSVRGNRWISDVLMEGPAAQPGWETDYVSNPLPNDQLRGGALPQSTNFTGTSMPAGWSWVRPPDPATYEFDGDQFVMDTQGADLFVDSNNASILHRKAPLNSWAVQTKVTLDLPAEGCCQNYVQAGLVIFDDDDHYVKLVHVSIWETRQTEFAKETIYGTSGFPRYGNTVVGPPGETTWLRIVKRELDTRELFTAYTSRNGTTWVRGGTWTHTLGDDVRVGLVAMGGTGFTASFDSVRFYDVEPTPNIIINEVHDPQP